MKFMDFRSRHAKLMDKALQATKVYPRTAWGIEQWRKNKAHSDLQGYDTSHQTRIQHHHENVKSRRYDFENMEDDLTDFKALHDSSLTGRENKDNIRRLFRDNMRF